MNDFKKKMERLLYRFANGITLDRNANNLEGRNKMKNEFDRLR